MRDEPKVYWNWLRTAAVVLAVVGVLQFYRANRPAPVSVLPTAAKYTTGTIVDAPVVVPPRSFVSYRVEFNRRTDLKGSFQTGDKTIRIECIVLDQANFEAWKSGASNQRLSSTGFVPGGKIVRVLEPGIFYIVISNRDAVDAEQEKTVQALFTAE